MRQLYAPDTLAEFVCGLHAGEGRPRRLIDANLLHQIRVLLSVLGLIDVVRVRAKKVESAVVEAHGERVGDLPTNRHNRPVLYMVTW